MELRTYLAIMWRRKWMILITAVVTVLVTAVGVFVMPPTYEASTTLRAAPAGGGLASYPELMYVTQLRNTFTEVVNSGLVLDEVAQRLGLDEPPAVKMRVLGNSELMLLTAKHSDPRLAQQVANTTVDVLLDLHKELYLKAEANTREIIIRQLAQAERDVTEARAVYESVNAQFPDDTGLIQDAAGELELKRQTYNSLLDQFETARLREALRTDAFSIYEPADLPEAPSGPPKVLYVAFGLMVGLTAGLGLAFLFENLDRTLHTTRQIEAAARVATLGKIPTAGKQHAIVFSNGRSPQEDAFRRLRTSLFTLDGSAPLQTLLMTSAEPQEGKTTIVVNLAHMIAESGRQVVAVDCDLRRPTMHAIFGLTNEIGLSSVLQEQATLDAALHRAGLQRLYVLTAGPAPSKPAELLGSQAMADLIKRLRQRFDMVLLDTPAIAAVADAAILAPGVDGVLLVVGRAKAREEAVQSACQQLADVKARLLGTVVNRAGQDGSYGYYPDYQQAEAVLATDPLTDIRGIGPVYEEVLRALGISTFAQLGKQDAEHLAHTMRADVTAQRIRRDRWIEQAQELSRRDVHL
jgi:capsular exopolysaccharide synthesis family protein